MNLHIGVVRKIVLPDGVDLWGKAGDAAWVWTSAWTFISSKETTRSIVGYWSMTIFGVVELTGVTASVGMLLGDKMLSDWAAVVGWAQVDMGGNVPPPGGLGKIVWDRCLFINCVDGASWRYVCTAHFNSVASIADLLPKIQRYTLTTHTTRDCNENCSTAGKVNQLDRTSLVKLGYTSLIRSS